MPKMSKAVDLIYKLEGPKVDRGIDVFQLSPMLLSIGQLIQDSNKLINPTSPEIAVNIKPFKEGSFIIEILLFAENNLQLLINSVNQDNVKEIKELLEWLGLTAMGTGGVIGIYKVLKGPPKTIERLEKGDVKITSQEGNSLVVNHKTFSLFQNNKVQQSVYNIYGNLLGKEGINTVKSYLKEEENNQVVVEKSDVPYFNPANTVPVEQIDENQKTNITRSFLKPKRISVEGEPDNWSFRKGPETIITASIKDVDFLNRIKSREIRLSNEDLIEVDLVETQTVNGLEINTKYDITKVWDYKPAPSQGTLLPE